MVNSNATGAFLWKLLEKGADAKELAAQLAASYEVDMAQAAHDVEKFLKILQENNLMEESENP